MMELNEDLKRSDAREVAKIKSLYQVLRDEADNVRGCVELLDQGLNSAQPKEAVASPLCTGGDRLRPGRVRAAQSECSNRSGSRICSIPHTRRCAARDRLAGVRSVSPDVGISAGQGAH